MVEKKKKKTTATGPVTSNQLISLREQRELASMQRRSNMAPHGKKLNTTSVSVKKRQSSNILLNAISYINILKLKIEAMNTQSLSPAVNNNQNEVPAKDQVEVEKKTGNGFHIRVNCQQKGRDNLLVSILEVFEEMDLEVLQASVSCNQCYSFCMEAMVESLTHDQTTTTFDAQAVSRALEHKLLEKKNASTSEVIRM